jgi:subtilisin family serine protease
VIIKDLKAIIGALIFLGCLGFVAAQPEVEVVPNKVMVKYKSETNEDSRVQIEQRYALTQVSEIKLFLIYVYVFDETKTSVDELCNKLMNESDVAVATPDHVRSPSSVNDADFTKQWYLNNTGQTVNGKSGPSGIDIRWNSARTVYNPTAKIKVAVVDSGINMLHPEIVNQINTESGYDFYSIDDYAFDQNGHGTLVAGIIASSINNQIGISGITNSVELIPYRVFDQFGRSGVPKYRVGTTGVSDVLLALATAVEDGAKIINLSLGGSGYNQLEKESYDLMMQYDAIAVVAAGNGGEDGKGDNNDAMPTYPASYPSNAIISVAAQQRSGGLASFSNYGVNSVDIAAPGEDIYGPDVSRNTIFSENFNGNVTNWQVGRSPGDTSFVNWTIETLDDIDKFLTDRPYGYLYGTNYYSGTNTWVKSPLIDLTKSTGSRLEFESFLSIGDDWLVVELSDDNFNWYPYAYYYGFTSNGYAQQQLDISDFDGYYGYLRFRFVTNNFYNEYGILIDNVKISGVDLFNRSGAKYQYNSGTSFAAPIVTGVAAMVWTQRPDLSAQKVREIILQSGRSVSSLSGKISTGKMVDANAAMLLAIEQPQTNSPPSI